MSVVTPDMVTTMHRGLTDFGYELRRLDVQLAVDRVMDEKEPEDIIDMWVKGWLEEAGLL
jgi:hypothetical protein